MTAIKFELLEPSIKDLSSVMREDCVPPPEEVRLGNWTYPPCPARSPDPMDSANMLGFFLYPNKAAEYLHIYHKIPKKLRTPSSRDDIGRHLAWGIFLREEGMLFRRYTTFTIALLLLCTILAIYY